MAAAIAHEKLPPPGGVLSPAVLRHATERMLQVRKRLLHKGGFLLFEKTILGFISLGV